MNRLKKITAKFTWSRDWGQKLVILIPYIWLVIFFLIPFFIIFKISFNIQEIAIPPYSHLLSYNPEQEQLTIFINFANYKEIFQDFGSSLLAELNPFNWLARLSFSTAFYEYLHQSHLLTSGDNIYVKTYLLSIYYAVMTTFLCLAAGYPMAYAISRARYKNLWLLLVMLPFWSSFLLRVYAWMTLLSTNGIINRLLEKLAAGLSFLFATRITIGPLDLFYNQFSLILVLVYTYLPFMILPLYTQLAKIDYDLIEAAQDLGAGKTTSFWQITWPLSRSGVIAGSMLVFIPVVGEYVIPELVGGAENLMIGKVLWQAFFEQNNWPLAATIAVTMVILLIFPLIVYHRYQIKARLGGLNGGK